MPLHASAGMFSSFINSIGGQAAGPAIPDAALNMLEGSQMATKLGLPQSTVPVPANNSGVGAAGGQAPPMGRMQALVKHLGDNAQAYMQIGAMIAPPGNPIRALGMGGANLMASKEMNKMVLDLINEDMSASMEAIISGQQSSAQGAGPTAQGSISRSNISGPVRNVTGGGIGVLSPSSASAFFPKALPLP